MHPDEHGSGATSSIPDALSGTPDRAVGTSLSSLMRVGPEELQRKAPERRERITAQPVLRPGHRGRAGSGLLGSLMLAAKVSAVLMLAWGFVFNVSEVRGLSMEPGIHDRDRILVDSLSYMVGGVDRGDVVVMRYPLDPSVDYIKRIVGLPGEEIVISFGQVWVDGQLLDEPYVDEGSIDPYTRLRTTVEPGHYFVMGDNRLRSSDSREFGQVPRELLRGKVQLRIWPPERVGWID